MKVVSIRRKIIVAGLVTTAVISTLLYLTLSLTIHSNVLTLQDSGVRKNLLRVSNGLDSHFDYLLNKSADWANWNDTYEFMDTDKDSSAFEEYESANLNYDSISTLDVEMILYLKKDGDIFYEAALDDDLNKLQDIPDGILKKIQLSVQGLSEKEGVNSMKGYISVKDKMPLMFVAQSIVRSDKSGEPNGVLVMAQYLNDSVVEKLSGCTLFPVYIQPVDQEGIPENLSEAKAILLKGEADFINHGADSDYGYTLYDDVWGNPSFIVRVNVPRELISQYLNTVNYSLLGIFFGGSALSVLSYFFIKKFALSPIRNLHQAVVSLSSGKSSIEAIKIDGNDEIAYLSMEIKKMLENLSKAENELITKNDDLKKINSFMVGRELKMVDLKEEIKKLKNIK